MRSIPACAGEPTSARLHRRACEVYPRVCGGTTLAPTLGNLERGLSPRVRGNHGDSMQGRRYRGSIPACAGEPASGHGVDKWRGVYPRVCGGTVDVDTWTMPDGGLSPRVRGNLERNGLFSRVYRSIPACAGEPQDGHTVACTTKVYPRVCGGTVNGAARYKR